MSPYPLHTILFMDIETVSQYRVFEEVPEGWKDLWRHKAEGLLRDKPGTPEEVYGRAAIYAEFGKVICISCGVRFIAIYASGSIRVSTLVGCSLRKL